MKVDRDDVITPQICFRMFERAEMELELSPGAGLGSLIRQWFDRLQNDPSNTNPSGNQPNGRCLKHLAKRGFSRCHVYVAVGHMYPPSTLSKNVKFVPTCMRLFRDYVT
jgi:hypothetical protein